MIASLSVIIVPVSSLLSCTIIFGFALFSPMWTMIFSSSLLRFAIDVTAFIFQYFNLISILILFCIVVGTIYEI